jgi:DNA polymerase-3 subunit delta
MATSMGNLYQVIRELDKIRDWFGGSEPQTVRLEDARQVLSGTELLQGWEVADAILDRNEPSAILAVRKLLQSGGNPIQLLGGVAHRARTMLQARAMLETGRSRRDIVSATRSYYIQDRLFAGIERYSFHDLQTFPGRLMKADRALKSSSVDPCLILEGLLHEMIAGQAKAPVRKK